MSLLSWYLAASTIASALDHSGPARGTDERCKSLTWAVKQILLSRPKIWLVDVKPLEEKALKKLARKYQLPSSRPPQFGVWFSVAVCGSEVSEITKFREALKTHASLKGTLQTFDVEWDVGRRPKDELPELRFKLLVFDRP